MPRTTRSRKTSIEPDLAGRLDALCRLAGEIAALRGERETLRTIVDAAARIIGSPSAHLALVDQGHRYLYGVVSSGNHSPEAPKMRYPLDQGPAATKALRSRRPVIITDARSDPRVHAMARRRLHIGSAAYLPLVGAERAFGLLILTAPKPRAWNRMEIRLAKYIANLASVALQTTRLLRTLAEMDERLRGLLRDVPAIVYTCDVQFPYRTHYVASQVEAILGYPPSAWIDDPELFLKLVHPDDVAMIVERAEAGLKARGPVRSEYRLLDSQGNTRWFRDDAVLIRDPAGKPIAWHGVLVEITKVKEIEKTTELAAPPRSTRPAGPGARAD